MPVTTVYLLRVLWMFGCVRLIHLGSPVINE
jgi:hypothetical protein